MKANRTVYSAKLLGRVLAGSLALAVPLVVQAQSEELEELELIQITGTYIPVSADAASIPITVITSQDLEVSAVTTNVLEVLRKAVPQFQGNQNIGANNANIASGSTGGGSQASLRNLTTLTLINGRRAAVSPITGTGGNQFVDLNIIPLAAVDQLQILLDGASATYGSDATSGVLNIITKRDFQGAQLSSFYEQSDNTGKWANRGINFVVGTSSGKTNITAAGGWSKQDPLFQYERDFSAFSYGTPTFGGVINIGANYFVLNPAYSAPPVAATKPTVAFPMATPPTAPDGKPYFGPVGSNAVYWGKLNAANQVVGFGAGELAFASTPEAKQVAFNLAQYVTILQRREAYGAIVSYDHEISDKTSLFGDFLFSKIDTFSQINAQPVGTNSSFNLTGAHVDNPFNATVRVRNRFVENPRQYLYETTFARAVLGLKGNLTPDISYETAVTYNKSELDFQNPGVIDSAKLLRAAGISPLATSPADRVINMFQRDIPSETVAAANFVGTSYNNFTSELNGWDGRILTKVFDLEAGPVQLALGAEYREERLAGTADLNSIPDETGAIGWTGATSVNPFSAGRDIWSGFAEARIPIFSPKQDIRAFYSLELGLAGRYEKYSDTDDPLVPKVTFRWLPVNDELAIRGSYSESFNAPTLYWLFGPSDVGFTPSVLLLPFGADPNDPNAYVGGQGQLRGRNNPELKPAESKAHTVGAVYSPRAVKGLSLEATYWRIKETDIVGVFSSQSILQDVEDNGPNSRFVKGSPNYIGQGYDVRVEGFGDSGNPITAPGQVANNIDSIYIDRPLVNISSQKASGIDFAVKYDFTTDNMGVFGVNSTFAYWIDYEFEDEPLAGRATTTGGTIPRWANYTVLTHRMGGWSSFLGLRYIPSVPAPEEITSGKTKAERYGAFDIGVSYDFTESSITSLHGLKVGFTVNNLTNEMPPYLPDTFPNANVDDGTYDPRGRTFILSASYRF